ncbi:hypothetical protein [Streptomyces marincola]|uniref:hypothetical protein n=1 Tax=Streptomyces marincola TaxID=2878388 RepID=UPI001CF20590|nr:hypothetical protein [Streptomyces marincola]UCM88012.1 hypothetical protein LC193_08610 [Streptomyces marincola]
MIPTTRGRHLPAADGTFTGDALVAANGMGPAEASPDPTAPAAPPDTAATRFRSLAHPYHPLRPGQDEAANQVRRSFDRRHIEH